MNEGEIVEETLYNVSEVSKLLKIGKNRVYDLIHAGLLPVLKIGGLKVRRNALEEFLLKYEGYDLTEPYDVRRMNEVDLEGDD